MGQCDIRCSHNTAEDSGLLEYDAVSIGIINMSVKTAARMWITLKLGTGRSTEMLIIFANLHSILSEKTSILMMLKL
jgi:hypothetical protein